MSTVYTGSPNINTSITIPVDGDVANAASVNVSSTALMDMQAFLLQTYGQEMESTCPLRVNDLGTGSDILVGPVPIAIVRQTGQWKSISSNVNTSIGIAQIEGSPTNYTPNSWYYIYIYSNGGTAAFEISLTAPDAFNLYKNGNFTHKFIASFRVDGASDIYNFNKYRDLTIYQNPITVANGSPITIAPMTTNIYMPPSASPSIGRACQLLITVDNSPAGPANAISILSDNPSNGQKFNIPTGGITTIPMITGVDASNIAYYFLQSTGPTTNIKISGYYE